MEIQPLVQGIFRFDIADQKVNKLVYTCTCTNKYVLNKYMHYVSHVLESLVGIM